MVVSLLLIMHDYMLVFFFNIDNSACALCQQQPETVESIIDKYCNAEYGKAKDTARFLWSS